jgi:hypothetical protein
MAPRAWVVQRGFQLPAARETAFNRAKAGRNLRSYGFEILRPDDDVHWALLEAVAFT